jgi:hypothetical protein
VNAAPNQRLTQLGVPENMQSYVRDLASRGMHNEAYEILSQFAKRPAGDGFTLKPGEQRFDGQGRPIASGGEEPIDYNKLLIPDPNNPGRPMLNQAYLDARAQDEGAFGDTGEAARWTLCPRFQASRRRSALANSSDNTCWRRGS